MTGVQTCALPICDLLNLAFSTHAVKVRGRHLRDVALALQKLAVEWIKEIAPKYAKLADPNTAVILSMEVSAIGDSPSEEDEQGKR